MAPRGRCREYFVKLLSRQPETGGFCGTEEIEDAAQQLWRDGLLGSRVRLRGAFWVGGKKGSAFLEEDVAKMQLAWVWEPRAERVERDLVVRALLVVAIFAARALAVMFLGDVPFEEALLAVRALGG